LTKLQDKYASKGFTVMAVNGYDEPKDEVEGFMTKNKLTHPVLLLGGKVALDVYGVEGFPTAFWIDHQGRIVGREVGFEPGHVPAMEKRIERLLAASARSKR
jgi:hypothetical protein